jgi:hypothetical protein
MATIRSALSREAPSATSRSTRAERLSAFDSAFESIGLLLRDASAMVQA